MTRSIELLRYALDDTRAAHAAPDAHGHEAVAAVTEPRGLKAGFNAASLSGEVSRRGPSSVLNWKSMTLRRLFSSRLTSCTETSRHSSLKRPASRAAIAFWWLW